MECKSFLFAFFVDRVATGDAKIENEFKSISQLKKSVDALPQKKNEEKLSSKTKLRTRNEGDD